MCVCVSVSVCGCECVCVSVSVDKNRISAQWYMLMQKQAKLYKQQSKAI